MHWKLSGLFSRRLGIVLVAATVAFLCIAWDRYDQQPLNDVNEYPDTLIKWDGIRISKTDSSSEGNVYSSKVSSDNETVTQTDVDPDWWRTVQGDIAQSEYHIRWQNHAGAFQSPNRAQNLRFTYWGDGFAAEAQTHEKMDPPWKLRMRLTSWGRRHDKKEFFPGKLNVHGNQAEAEGIGITVTYRNDHEGMRQEFLIEDRPSGSGPLRLFFSTELSGVVAEVQNNGREVTFGMEIPGGAQVLTYGELEVLDAGGNVLPAIIVKEEEWHFTIVVDDTNAIYPLIIDPLSSSPDWTTESNQNDARFGCSVASAGDVDGDGYSDVIVGAEKYDNGESDEGRAFVYLGSPSGLAASPSWTAESDQENAYFGTSVATAGDVNGDGYSDIIVGANLYDNGQTNEGRAFVYHGSGSGLSVNPDWTAESDETYTSFGGSVANAGDVNGDGYSDVIIGAKGYDNGETNEGNATVYLGSASGLETSPVWTAESNQADARFGTSVASAGDVNGDGYSDIIVGADRYDNGHEDEGRAFVYLGSELGPGVSPIWTAESDQAFSFFGCSVATSGDVNGDGYSDVIVGAHCYDSGGRSYVYLGSPAGPQSTSDWTADSDQDGAYFGHSVSTAGDINGDGYSDVIVGAYIYDNGETSEGRAFVYLGSDSGLAANPTWIAESDQDYADFGITVATAGDVNGDGFSDIIVGAHRYSNGQTDEGGAFVYLGGSMGPSESPGWTAESNQANASYGWSVTTAGDVNGDGFSDVIIGAYEYDNGQTNEGRAFVYLGSVSGLSASPIWTAESDQSSAYFGWTVATAGDVNGDGFSDVIVGAYNFDNDETDEGTAFVYLGNASGVSTSPDWTAESDQTGASFGWAVATGGDVNSDGYSDVIIGAPKYDNDETDEGAAFLYLGNSAGLPTSPDWMAESNQTDARFGCSVASAGDVNGDGYSDIIIGAFKYDNGESDEGASFVYPGNQSGPQPNPAWMAESNQIDARFGYSVAGAGDVNGDGFSDAIVGAYWYDNGETDEGRAFVYLGSFSGLTTSPAWTTESNQAYARFGQPVGTAGDVNGDGYSDVIVGAYSYDNGQTNEGQVSVYFGSLSGLNTSADWTAESDQFDAYFGYSAASAGDVNGDGYSDIIVGAFSYSHIQFDEGAAFLYYGNNGDGVQVLPRQWRTDLVTPVVPALKTRSSSQAGLSLLARTFFGRNDIRVQFEIKPLGMAFDGTDLVTTGWFDPNITGAAVSAVISGLSDRTMYKWRARVGYRLFDGAPQPYGRWIYQPYNGGLGEVDFQISDDDQSLPPAHVPKLSVERLSSTHCRLWWHSVAGATSYNFYLGNSAFFSPTTPWQTVAAPDTTYTFSAGVGDPVTNYYFLCRSVGTWGESINSDRVGEFDYLLP